MTSDSLYREHVPYVITVISLSRMRKMYNEKAARKLNNSLSIKSSLQHLDMLFK